MNFSDRVKDLASYEIKCGMEERLARLSRFIRMYMRLGYPDRLKEEVELFRCLRKKYETFCKYDSFRVMFFVG